MHKKNTRVDLTPMVDLGFLLLTFFVFTTTLSQPNVLAVRVPNDKDTTIITEICNSCALTLIPAENGNIYYYEGAAENNPEIKITSFTVDGLRKTILAKKEKISALKDPGKELVLAIKPGDDCNYQNFVNILDEVTINDVKHYFIAKPGSYDKKLLPGLWN